MMRNVLLATLLFASPGSLSVKDIQAVFTRFHEEAAALPLAPAEGQDLNPVLQDRGLAVHPPLLYLGYVGFSVCFSFAVAALIGWRYLWRS